MSRHTDSGHDLSFQPKLILEAPCKITDPTPTVTADIRHPPDVIEHVSGCEQEHGDQAQASPYITILDNGHGVRVGDGYERDETENGGCDGDKVDPIEGSFDRRLRSIGKLSRDPGVDGFGGLRSENALGTSNAADVHDNTYPELKSNRTGELSTLALGPVVGLKKRRTGACWSPSFVPVSRYNSLKFCKTDIRIGTFPSRP